MLENEKSFCCNKKELSCSKNLKTKKIYTIKILDTDYKNCLKLEENVKLALKELYMDANVFILTDNEQIVNYGVILTPGLVLNEKLVSFGKVLSVEEIIQIIVNNFLGK